MIKFPLFGKDSSPQYTAPRLAGIGTLILWILFLLISAIVPQKKPKKYETVQIVLDTTPVEKIEKVEKPAEKLATTKTEPIPVEKTVEKAEKIVEPAPVQPKPVETPAPKKESVKSEPKKTEPKPAPKKQETAKTQTTEKPASPSAPAAAPELYKSVEDRMAEQAQKRTSPAEFNWDSFNDGPTENQSVSQNSANKVQKIDNSQALSGNAGDVSTSSNQRSTSQIVSSGFNKKPDYDVTIGKDLNEIANAVQEVYSGKNSDVTAETVTENGETKIVSSDKKSSRKILTSLVIDVVENAKFLVAGERYPIEIDFVISEDGRVLRESIGITPSNLLHPLVKEEVKDEVCKWRFSPAQTESRAKIRDTIIIDE